MKLWILLMYFREISNLVKIRPVGAEMFHADGQTDGGTGHKDRRNDVNSRFTQFCERA